MLFSILIPVRDDLRNLRRCLGALGTENLADCEVLVADDGSQPPLTVADLPDPGVRLRLFRLPGEGPARARNLLARHAAGEYLFFLDADTEPQPGLLDRARGVIAAEPGIPSFFGSYDDAPAWPSLISVYRNLLHHYVHHQSAGLHVSTFWCGCGVIRRRLYLDCGGISEMYQTPSIEDLAFGTRLREAGVLTRVVPELQVKHHKRWTLRSWLYTDLFRRGIPWVRLMRARKEWTGQLNFSWSQRMASLAALAVPLLLAAGLWRRELAPAAIVPLAVFVALNFGFLKLIARKQGVWAGVVAVPLHLLYAWICVASVAAAFCYPPLELDESPRRAALAPAD